MIMRHLATAAAILAALLPAACVFAGSDELTVAADGSGPYKTVQSAIDAAPENSKSRIVIQIKPGTYKERLIVPKSKPMLTFKGGDSDPAKIVLTFDLNANSKGPDGKN